MTILDAPRWQAFIAACGRAGLGTATHEHFRVPRIDTSGDWQAYRASWSANHRRNMTRHPRQLAAALGELQLRLATPAPGKDLGALLRRGFELEDGTWKGAAGSSVLRSPGMYAFFCRQAEILAARGELQLAFLEAGGRPLAYHYAWVAKGVYHPFKVGFDESLRDYGPGQLLIHEVLAHCFASPEYKLFDCVGPATPATDKWQTSSYSLGRLVVAPRKLLGQSLLYAYKNVWPALRRWKGSHSTAVDPALAS